MADEQNPCEVPLLAAYPFKGVNQIKQSLRYIDAIRGNITDRGALRIFMQDYAKNLNLELGTKLLAELDTLGKHALNTDRILNPAFNGDHLQAALSIYESTTSQVKGAGINAEALIQVKQKAYFGKFSSDMGKIGFQREVKAGAFDAEIREAIRTGKPYDGLGADKVNQAVAVFKNAYSIMNHELNTAGLRVSYRNDYSGPIVHDGSAIYDKFPEWVNSLSRALDIKKEFPEISLEAHQQFDELVKSGNVQLGSKNEVLKMLEFSYNNITSKESALRDEIPHSLERPASIADRRSYARSFTTWRDGQAITDYLNEFGKYKTLGDQMAFYTRQAAKDVGLVTNLGATPTKGHQMVKDLVKNRMTLDGASEYAKDEAMKTLDTAYSNLTGGKRADPNLIGSILQVNRIITGQAKLGMSGFTQLILDPIGTTLQTRTLMQQSFIKDIYTTVANYIPSVLEATHRKDLADVYLHSATELQTIYEEMFKMNNGVMNNNSKLGSLLNLSGEMVTKYSGASFFNKVSYITNAKIYTSWLADAVNAKEINPVMQADLDKFNVTKEDLKVVSQLNLGGREGLRNLFNITAQEYADILPEKYKSIEDAQHGMTAFMDRMNLWLMDKIKTGAQIPGNRERRILNGDSLAGTPEGEIRRIFTQLKMTALKAFLETTVGTARKLDTTGPQGGKPDWTNGSTMRSMGSLAAYLTVGGAALILVNAILSNDKKTMKKFEQFDPSLLPEAFVRGGGGFILGDFISMGSNPAMNVSKLVGPAAQGIVTPPALIADLSKGKAAGAGLKLIKTYAPGSNMWFFKPFMSGMSDYVKTHQKRSGSSSKHGIE